MISPEFPFDVTIKEEKDRLRIAAGNGSEVIDPDSAQAILQDLFLVDTIQAYMKIGLLKIKRETVTTGLTQEAPSCVWDLAKVIDGVAPTMIFELGKREGGLGEERENLQTTLITFHDISVGLELVPALVRSFEQVKAYNEAEGIRNPVVTAQLEQYARDPVRTIGDAVSTVKTRYVRGSKDVGIYVPEFLVAGAEYGNRFFADAYGILTRTPT